MHESLPYLSAAAGFGPPLANECRGSSGFPELHSDRQPPGLQALSEKRGRESFFLPSREGFVTPMSPLQGLGKTISPFPRLTPWATVCRRYRGFLPRPGGAQNVVNSSLLITFRKLPAGISTAASSPARLRGRFAISRLRPEVLRPSAPAHRRDHFPSRSARRSPP